VRRVRLDLQSVAEFQTRQNAPVVRSHPEQALTLRGCLDGAWSVNEFLAWNHTLAAPAD
jgi:hypothetical protein